MDKIPMINEVMRDIPFLIKFQDNQEYANQLLHKGGLFMQSARYYVTLKGKAGIKGQGDVHEGSLFNCYIGYGTDLPIYCMYGVYKNQIDLDGNIIIDKKVISDFCSDGGVITVVDTLQFIADFEKACIYRYDIGMCSYRIKSVELDTELFTKKRPALHYKTPSLKYQQEFIIVVDYKLELQDIPYDRTPIIPEELKESRIHSKEHKPYIMYIGDMSAYSTQINFKIGELQESSKTSYIIPSSIGGR